MVLPLPFTLAGGENRAGYLQGPRASGNQPYPTPTLPMSFSTSERSLQKSSTD